MTKKYVKMSISTFDKKFSNKRAVNRGGTMGWVPYIYLILAFYGTICLIDSTYFYGLTKSVYIIKGSDLSVY
ncbi:hypothetical protein YSY22_00950 [Brevibacillus formosus]